MNSTKFFEKKILEHVLRNVTFTSPTTVYLALLRNNPSESLLEAGDLANELALAGYARQPITFSAVDTNITYNAQDIEFGPAEENWGTITHIYIMDAPTGGNALYWKNLSVQRTIYQDDILKVPINNLTVRMD